MTVDLGASAEIDADISSSKAPVPMTRTHHGGCHCGKVRFEIAGQALHSTICHCKDCRGQSGAPILAWAMVPAEQLSTSGEAKNYRSSETGERFFCGECGTGLFFSNAPLRQMGMIQVRIAALDDPGAIAPAMQVQTAERIGWMASAHDLPSFERFPG